MPAPAAEIDAATVSVDGRRVLGPLSLEVQAGAHWALLGPNGAGKTTLLSLIGAQRHPSTGTVHVLGQELGRTDLRELRRRIGVVGHSISDRLPFQASALEIVLTGKDGLLAPWWGEFDDADRDEAHALLARLRCDQLAAQPFGHCSQGERQRVLIARSLFGRHKLLLLDEPVVGVDLPGREALVAALDELARDREAPTTIQVAHTLEELPSSVSHALLLRDGLPVASGPVDEVLGDGPLSACYGLAVHVEERDGRRAAWAAGSW